MAKSSDPFKTEAPATEATPSAAVQAPAPAPVQAPEPKLFSFQVETLFGKKTFTFDNVDEMKTAAMVIAVNAGHGRSAEVNDIAGKHLMTNSLYIFLGKQFPVREKLI